MLRALVLPCLPECQHSTSFPSTVKLPSGEPCCIVAVHHGFKTLSWNHMEKQSCARPSGLFCLFSYFFFFPFALAASWRRIPRQQSYKHASGEGCVELGLPGFPALFVRAFYV